MAPTITALTPADSRRLVDVDLAAYFLDPSIYSLDEETSHFDWTRTFGATREGSGDLAGIYTSYDMAVTAPGPLDALTRVPMAGLSWVAVHPDHRRRGVLRSMVHHHVEQLHEAGVPLSGLHASEPLIYGRFGYGLSSLDVVLSLGRGTTFAAPELDEAAAAVETWFVNADSDEVAATVHDLHLRCAETALGAVTRPDIMSRPTFRDRPLARQGAEPLKVLFAAVDGRPSGYAVFARKQSWEDATARGTVDVRELAAADPASLLALARRLVDFDLTVHAEIGSRGLDDSLLWWAGGPRAVPIKTFDALWLRPVDVDRALTARGYASGCDVVLDVIDEVCPWNQRRWRLTVDDAGVGICEPTADPADVRMPVQALGSAYLGSRSLVSQADQGLVHELRPGALRSLSRAWRSDREPVGAIEF